MTSVARLGCCSSGVSSGGSLTEVQPQQHETLTDAGSNAVVSAATAAPLDFRILTEPIPMQPNKSAYGVPYDLIDTAQGSAMSEMLLQLQHADTALTAMHLVTQSSKPEE